MCRPLVPLFLLALAACGKPPDCPGSAAERSASLREKAEEVCAERGGPASTCHLLSAAQVQDVLGDPAEKTTTSQGTPVWRYEENGCEDFVAILYLHGAPESPGYLVASGRVSAFAEWADVGDLIASW